MFINKLAVKKLLGLSPKINVQKKIPTEFHGTTYGGWTIRQNSLESSSKVISAGIGNDISFDISVIEKYNVKILGVDPTPAVAKWISDQTVSENFNFLPLGIGAEDGDVKFFEPENKSHISHSAKPSSANNNFILVPVITLSNLFTRQNIQKVDLLKMDIEGFEYAVIDHIVENNLEIEQLLIEFHHGLYSFSVADTSNAVASLNKAGYSIFHISSTGREVSFIKNRSI